MPRPPASRFFGALLLALLIHTAGSQAAAQSRSADSLDLRTLFTTADFLPTPFRGGAWAEEGPIIRYIDRDTEGATHLIEFDLETGQRSQLLDGSTLEQPEGDGLIQIEGYQFAADGRRALIYTDSERVWRLNTKGFYYVVDLVSGEIGSLSDRESGFQMFAKFSPDGELVAFVRDRNLFLVELATMEETQLTYDGSDGGIINGTFDWVYEEEFGLRDGFEWSPDGRHIAFFQLDESDTREYTMVDVRPLYPRVHQYRYPKAGEKNSEIRIGVIEIDGGVVGETRFFETNTWRTGDSDTEYLSLMGWTPSIDGQHHVWMFRMNRDQNDLDLIYGDPRSGETQIVLNETEDTFIDVETGFSDLDMGTISYLDDGRHFVWRSDRSGFSHLYLYRNDGTYVRHLTEGAWDVTTFHGIDEDAGYIYVTGTVDGPRERHLYRIPFDSHGSASPGRLTAEDGWHTVNTSPDLRYFIGTHSTLERPPVTALYDIRGSRITPLEENRDLVRRITSLGLPTAEWITVPAADGTDLNGYVIKPSDFDSTRTYPVLIYTYGGPGSQVVRNAWLGNQHLWHHWLAEEHGIIVVAVDNRGTGGRGKAFKAQTYGRLGILEAEDKIAVAKHLSGMPFVDGNRIGIWGWSYGGYLALLAMLYEEGPETFSLGVAVAPVTSWRFYDTIYTERYLSTPQANPDGYDLGSPLTYAGNLRDDQRLLIVHGDNDDNVHVQNAIVMAEALIGADRQFDFMIYPGRDHGISGANTRFHLFTLISRFITENL